MNDNNSKQIDVMHNVQCDIKTNHLKRYDYRRLNVTFLTIVRHVTFNLKFQNDD